MKRRWWKTRDVEEVVETGPGGSDGRREMWRKWWKREMCGRREMWKKWWKTVDVEAAEDGRCGKWWKTVNV